MANQWLRLWHDMPNDPKWRTIARISKQSIGNVIAVYIHVMVNASANANERGRTKSLCSEDIASALDIDTSAVEEILTAMQGRVLENDCLSGWNKRQPDREDGSAERAKAWRESKKQTQANAGERTSNAGDTEPNAPDKDTDKEQRVDAQARPSRAITFKTWIASIPEDESAIAPDDPVFAYAERVGLPGEFVGLEWAWFKAKYSKTTKRYADWRHTFRNAVEGAWGNLWRLNPDGAYQLTTQGLQFQRSLGEGA